MPIKFTGLQNVEPGRDFQDASVTVFKIASQRFLIQKKKIPCSLHEEPDLINLGWGWKTSLVGIPVEESLGNHGPLQPL